MNASVPLQVSNGAECVLIKKSWLLQHASESAMRTLRSQVGQRSLVGVATAHGATGVWATRNTLLNRAATSKLDPAVTHGVVCALATRNTLLSHAAASEFDPAVTATQKTSSCIRFHGSCNK